MDIMVPAPAVGGTEGNYCIQVNLPSAFVIGDGLALKYISPEGQKHSDIERQACLELFCYLVVSAPARVRLHENCFRGGQQKVQEFKEKAVQFAQEVGFERESLAWQIPEIHVGQPLKATVAIGKAESPVPPSCNERPAVGSTGRPGVGGYAAVLDVLRGLHANEV